MKSRKSQSELVSTVILILIVLAAVSVVWVVINFIFDFRNEDRHLCTNVKLDAVEAKDRGIVNADRVIITRLAGGEQGDVAGVKIIINGKSATIIQVDEFPCGHSTHPPCESSLTQRQTKTFNVSTDIMQGDKVEVAALVGETRYVCEITDTVRAT